MAFHHVLLVIGVIFIWGTNFVPARLGLNEFPPFTFAALRFIFAVLPWIFFVPRPKVAVKWLATFGLLNGPGQFGLLYYAMHRDISPGLASLLIQCQVFFTIALASWLLKERMRQCKERVRSGRRQRRQIATSSRILYRTPSSSFSR